MNIFTLLFQLDDENFYKFQSYLPTLYSYKEEINPISQHKESKKLSEAQRKKSIILLNYVFFHCTYKIPHFLNVGEVEKS